MNSEERKHSSGKGIATRKSCGQRNNYRPGGSGVGSLPELASRIKAAELTSGGGIRASWKDQGFTG